MAMPVQTIFDTLRQAGVHVTPAPDGLLHVTPASRLTPELRALIRGGKADLVRWFTSAPNDPEPPLDRAQWLDLDREYQRHHWKCPICISGGQGRGLRCGFGAALWVNYQNTVTSKN